MRVGSGGDSVGRILQNYPGITEGDIRACLGYAALLTREQVLTPLAHTSPS
ncbi:MAG TPA: DUF433 domain-containing protein [Thermoleophilia bacterium]|nr:DUF433 domain-containing protein [Thermoleophilia bacterium]